jgi:CBS-domain-containing membrane protein
MSPERILSKLGVSNVITANSEDTVEQVLRLLDDKQVRAVPIVDSEGVFKGMFSTHEVIKSLVPSYMIDGMQTLDFAAGASDTLASRLRKLYPTRVGDHVCTEDCIKITEKTQTWEVLRMLSKYGSPIPAINSGGHLIGLISEQSAIEALLKMEADEADTEE